MKSGVKISGESNSVSWWPIMTIVVLVLASIFITSHLNFKLSSQGTTSRVLYPSYALDGGASSATWYCEGFGGALNGIDYQDILLNNPLDKSVSGYFDIVLPSGKTLRSVFTLPKKSFQVADIVQRASQAAEMVEVNLSSGGVVVSLAEHIATGWITSGCAPMGAQTLTLPGGSTNTTSQYYLAISNPGPSTAVANISIFSTNGFLQPPSIQGLVVARDSTLLENLSIAAPDESISAVSVSAMQGSPNIVAAMADVSTGVTTISVGSPSVGNNIIISASESLVGETESITVVNAGETAANVSLIPLLTSGLVATPITAVVASQSSWVVSSSTFASSFGGSPHGYLVKSNAAVTAFRTISNSYETQCAFALPFGTNTALGASTFYQLAGQGVLTLLNPSSKTETASVLLLSSQPSAGKNIHVVIQPESVKVLSISFNSSQSVGYIVHASGPIIAEGDMSDPYGNLERFQGINYEP
ncbi:MAG: hypothetical protein HKL80_08745 [Acidimicrobiales bacterium]|nr:hypothetical protein [Acidimicrobiales bacterium]